MLVWNLGSVAPMQSLTATLTLSVPTSVASLIELDAGAVAWGTASPLLAGGTGGGAGPVRAQARPVTLGPEAVGACVFPTVEADPADPYVLRRAAQLGQEPLAMFEYVRSLGHEVYAGSLRGARGAEWSMGGNALDKSSLLIALLRGVGIDARYRHGTLSDERARELILSMFPATGAVVGYVPEGVPLSDPASDPKLLAEARDHWWVEAQVDGEWVDLDPSFGYAEAGQTFAVPEGAPVCEPADSLRHKVTVSVEAENYHMLNYIQGGFGYTTVLTHTFTTAELVGEPLTLEHLVAYESPPCMIFCWTRYTYVPYLRLGDQQTIIRGEPFWEMLSNFPFGQWAATAEWIHFDVQNPAGGVMRYTRQVADRLRIGPQGGPLREPKAVQSLMTAEVASSLGPGIPSLVHEADSHTIYFNPSWMSEEYAAHVGDDLLVATPRLAEVASLAVGLGDLESILAGGYQPPLDAVGLAEANEVVEGTTQAFDRVMGATFVTMSDWAAQDLAETGQVAVYPDAPRITIASSVVQQSHLVTETRQLQVLDLLHDGLRVIAYPGQAQGAERIYRMTRGVCNTFLESAVGEELTGERSKSAANVLQAAQAQGIELAYVDAEHLDVLNEVAIPTQAKAFILDTVLRGYAVLVPERMVEWHGEQAIAWWQLDLETGEMVGVGEDGTHFFLVVFAVFMSDVFLPMILLLLHLVTLLLRLLVWRLAAEETWRHFWREAGEGVAGAEGEGRLQEVYQEALDRTKAHMQGLRWWLPAWLW